MSLFPGKGKFEDEQDNLGVDWVIHYQFEDLGWSYSSLLILL